MSISSHCEVIGWVHVDSSEARVLVMEKSGRISAQRSFADSAPGSFAIQTGAFRRGKQIVDPITHEVLGYEMENLPSPLAAAV